MKNKIKNKKLEEAFNLAVAVRKKSYSPYSKFPVGASIKFIGIDDLVTGTNVENASFGATNCAEKSAICKAISIYGKLKIEYVVVVTDTSPAIGPCGLCLQFISEFSTEKTKIYFCNLEGIQKAINFSKLMTNPFNKIPKKPVKKKIKA